MFQRTLSQQLLSEFNDNGYCIIKDFCSQPEVKKLYYNATINADQLFNAQQDGSVSSQATVSNWFNPGDDIFGVLEQSEKMVHTVAQILKGDSPVCHVYSKLMEKRPNVGGVWEWHQDYAYWQKNNFLSADKMLGVMIALTAVNSRNGSSQLIKGSHKLGKLVHNFEGKRTGADRLAIEKALKNMEVIHLDLNPGDALFFHSNLLHRADANLSPASTWSNVSCYSLQSNLQGKQMFNSWTTPIEVVPDEAILHYKAYRFPEAAFVNQQLFS